MNMLIHTYIHIAQIWDMWDRWALFLRTIISEAESSLIRVEEKQLRHSLDFWFLQWQCFWERSGVKAGVEVTARLIRGLMTVPIRAGFSLYFLSHVSQRAEEPSLTLTLSPSAPHMIIGQRRMRSHPDLHRPAARYRWSGRAGRSRIQRLTDGIKHTISVDLHAREYELILTVITH